jgi:hypothetical protein
MEIELYRRLQRSHYRKRGGHEYKSCPGCSVKRQRLVFHPVKIYGVRTMPDGRVIPQSWCPDCRNEKKREIAKRRRAANG